MNPAVLAVEGRSWARAAARRIEAAQVPISLPIEEPDRLTDLGQGIEALDRALRYAKRISDMVSGTATGRVSRDHLGGADDTSVVDGR